MVRKSKGDMGIIEAVDRHVSKYIGEVAFVMDEIDSPYVHIDVHIVLPAKGRNFYTLVTSGMSELAMPAPKDAADARFAELMICLPPDWPLTQEGIREERNWWPIKLLKEMARFPHAQGTWMWEGHTYSLEKNEPLGPNTNMTGAVLLRPATVADEGCVIHIANSKRARLSAVYPIYPEELELAQQEGSADLAMLLAQGEVTEVLDLGRKNVALFC